jgi:hypothetical protein
VCLLLRIPNPSIGGVPAYRGPRAPHRAMTCLEGWTTGIKVRFEKVAEAILCGMAKLSAVYSM